MLKANFSSWPVDATEVKEGRITVKGHTQVQITIVTLIMSITIKSGSLSGTLNIISFQCVSEGALSPDGTVLATASHDGYIKFWQLYIEGGQDKPR